MISLDNAVVARKKRGEDHFKLLVDPHEAEQLIERKEIDILSALAIEAIFKDSKKEPMPLKNLSLNFEE